jgi:hypothetical protein
MKKNLFIRGSRSVTYAAVAVIWTAAFLLATNVESAIIWNGPTITFTKLAGSDPTQAANQDRLTPDIWITRGGVQGLYNAKTEASYTHNSSPADTEWAFGELANYASLTYTNWEGLYGGSGGAGPPSLIGKDTVVHLISEDVYLSVNLASWGVGFGGGGGFSYVRSTPPVIVPTPSHLTGTTLSGGGTFQFTFTNTPSLTFTVLGTTNLSLPFTNWDVLGQATDAPSGSGSYQFSDLGTATNRACRFYLLRWP